MVCRIVRGARTRGEGLPSHPSQATVRTFKPCRPLHLHVGAAQVQPLRLSKPHESNLQCHTRQGRKKMPGRDPTRHPRPPEKKIRAAASGRAFRTQTKKGGYPQNRRCQRFGKPEGHASEKNMSVSCVEGLLFRPNKTNERGPRRQTDLGFVLYSLGCF